MNNIFGDIIPLAAIVSPIIAGTWIIALIIGLFRQRLRLRAQTDIQNKMLEKFSSADEFAAYLQSDAGRKFFESMSNISDSPLNKILGSIQKGAILTLLGLGFFVLRSLFSADDGGNAMLVIGTVFFTIGAGFLISSAIAYRLAKTWGLISVEKSASSNAPSLSAS